MARTPRNRVRGGASNDAWGRRGGKEGLARAGEERKKAAERSNSGPWRFGLNKGDEREIIILDASLDDFWYMYEHTYYNKGDTPPVKQFGCSREFEECPICEEAAANPNGPYNQAAWTIFLTVIECHPDDPYEDRDGVEHTFSKRLMAVKATQAADLERIFDIVMKKEGTLRGLCLLMARDEGKQSIRIGKPVMNDQGEMYELLSEDYLDDEFGHDAVVKDGKTVREENWMITPYEYTKLFPKPDAVKLAEETGLELAAGSAASIRQELDEDEDEDQDEGTSRRSRSGRSGGRSGRSGRAAQSTTGARRRSRSRARDEEPEQEEDQQDEDQGEDEEQEERTSRRSRSRPRASSSRSSGGRSRSRPRSEPEEDEPEDDAPPPRSNRRRRGRAAAADDIPM